MYGAGNYSIWRNSVFFLWMIAAAYGCSSDSSSASEPSTGQLLGEGGLQVQVEGSGYLIISNQGASSYRRGATLRLGDGGLLESTTGRVQGFVVTAQGNVIEGVLNSIDLGGVDLNGLEINADGLITSESDGRQIIRGKIAVAQFPSPFNLNEISQGEFAETNESGQPIVSAVLDGLNQLRVGDWDVPPQDLTIELATRDGSYFALGGDPLSQYSTELVLHRDKNGNAVTDSALILQGYLETTGSGLEANTVINTSTLANLQFVRQLAPRASTMVSIDGVLSSNDNVKVGVFRPEDSTTFNLSKKLPVYDSFGNEHSIELFFRQTGQWQLYFTFTSLGGSTQSGGPFTVSFDTFGDLTSTSVISIGQLDVATGASAIEISVDLDGISQLVQPSSIIAMQDGYGAGILKSVEVDSCGKVFMRYHHALKLLTAQVATVRFADASGLSPSQEGFLLETPSSGAPVPGTPCDSGFSMIQGDDLDT